MVASAIQPNATASKLRWLSLITTFIVAIALAACVRIRPDESVANGVTPVSAQLEGFLWQTDERYGYRMLRPVGWDAVDLVTARGYFPTGATQQAAPLLLTAVNLETLAAIAAATDTPQVVPFDFFQQTPALLPWTAAMEKQWQAAGLTYTRLQAVVGGLLYAFTVPDVGSIRLVALVVRDSKPFLLQLESRETNTTLQQLRDRGIFADFVTMVDSVTPNTSPATPNALATTVTNQANATPTVSTPTLVDTIVLYSAQTLDPAAPTQPTWGLQAATTAPPFDNPVFTTIYGNLGTGENYPVYFINFRPRQSPDGRYVLIPGIGGYNPPAAPGTGLWLADLQAKTVQQLLPTVPIAVWSPQSDAIAYLADNTLYVRNLTGNEPPNALFTNDELAAPFLTWSPDGQWLAVITVHQGDIDPKTNYPTLTQTLWLVSSSTYIVRKLVTLPLMAMEHANSELTWTSDSQHLILQDQVISLDGTYITIGSVRRADGVQPLSAPSAIVANRTEGLQLFTLDGTLMTAITTTPVTTWAVSPDGQRLAYALDSSATTSPGIGVFDLITQQPVTTLVLPEGVDQVGILRWNATGDQLYLDDWRYNSPIWALPVAQMGEPAVGEPEVIVEDGLLVEVLIKPSIKPSVPADAEALTGRELERWSSPSADGAWVAEGLTAFPKGNDNLYYTELRVKRMDGDMEWTPVALWSKFGLGYIIPRPLQWSPDGQYLYFTNAPVPDGCGLFVNAADLRRLDLMDGTVTEVLPFGATSALAIAPDTQKAVYNQGDTLYLLDLATADYASIKVAGLEVGAQWGNFVWSPDSQQVAFTIAYQPCMSPEWSHSLLLLDTQAMTITTLLEKDPRRLTVVSWADAGHLMLTDHKGQAWMFDLAAGSVTIE